jgi:hypothetical protein
MKMKEQWKGPRKWKIVAGVGTAAALGVTGMALAGPGDASGVPAPITLERQVTTSESLSPSTTIWVTTAAVETRSATPNTAPSATTATDKAQSPSPSTTLRVTIPTGLDDVDCSLDDCADSCVDDCADGTCSSIDSAPDSPGVAQDDASDSIDCADSSVDS